MSTAIGWDSADTARYYGAVAGGRYATANAALVAHAALERGMRVLDVAAGTGATAEAALGEGVAVVCFEPAAAMREAGARRLAGNRVQWSAHWPDGVFDRVLCGAAIWQLQPLAATFARCAASLRPGGALVFNIPAAYLGEPDGAGGGEDPWLVGLAVALAALGHATPAALEVELPDADGVERLARAAGLQPRRWSVTHRLTQAELCAWMKVPVLTDRLLAGMTADERAAAIDAADLDPGSWRPERWLGWTCRRS